jgi:transcriptional regulator with XRE-family HTH domain
MYSFAFMINEFLLKEFGDRIKQLRLQKNISQEKLSFLTGFHRTYIGMIERGERNISISNMAVFAKVFELNISELIDLKTINPNHSYKNYEIKSDK